MSAMRDELHHLVDRLPEAELRPALELIRGRVGQDRGAGRDLPFFSSFGAEPELAERSEEILRAELGRSRAAVCHGRPPSAGHRHPLTAPAPRTPVPLVSTPLPLAL